jgi:hypothetical protein
MASLKCIILTVMDESHQVLKVFARVEPVSICQSYMLNSVSLETGQCTEMLEFLY